MPLHDWSRVPAGLYHDFHQSWSIRIKDALNSGGLPGGLSALVEQRALGLEPDVLAIETRSDFAVENASEESSNGGVATMAPPHTSIVRPLEGTEAERYAERANRIVVRHHLGTIVAVIEIVSPGNKDGRTAFRRFVEKTVEFLEAGVHVLIVDPFPPTPRDPSGIHQAIAGEFQEETFEFPVGQDRLLVSYEARPDRTAYIEPLAVGDPLPDMPLFVADHLHVPVSLESTYETTWAATPAALRDVVESTDANR